MTNRLSAPQTHLRNLSFVAIPASGRRSSFCLHPSAFSSAFTLVELLVVVAVLGILAALILPVVNSSQKAANSAACVSNLKQIGVALFSYVADHDGAFPSGANLVPPDPSYANPYLWFQALEDGYMGGNSQKGYSKEHPSWQECPSKKFLPTDKNRMNVGYGWNYWAGTYTSGVGDGGFGYDAQNASGYGYNSRLSQVTHPAKTIIVGDSMDTENHPAFYNNIFIYPPSSTFPDKMRASRHGGKGNYLMVDGHVEALPPTMEASYFKKIK
jgi:prepilin-type processing-associated H-X9-DG protein/prepilin-type N-terminal cleavage/methylation domain-containing protein